MNNFEQIYQLYLYCEKMAIHYLAIYENKESPEYYIMYQFCWLKRLFYKKLREMAEM